MKIIGAIILIIIALMAIFMEKASLTFRIEEMGVRRSYSAIAFAIMLLIVGIILLIV